VRQKNRDWIVLGKADIDEVNAVIEMGIPDSSEYDTFSGFVLEQIGRIPKEDEKLTIGGFEIVVKSMDGNRIKEYIVRAIKTVKPDADRETSA
jgi:CBS domain containing-hemolysin-like protein